MSMTVRQCMRCGREDLRERWPSMDDAIEAGALSEPWTCPVCAWVEADLVEATTGTSAKAPGDEAPPRSEAGADGDMADQRGVDRGVDEARRAADDRILFRYPH